MKSITVSHVSEPVRQLKPHSPITPLCVPMGMSSGFSEEVSGRFNNRVYSLWERLGLVFLEEESAEPYQAETHVVVNNFTQQIILQLFSQKNISRLIDLNQPGFVLIDRARSAARSAVLTERKRIIEQFERRREEKTIYIREFENALRLFTDEGQEKDTHVSDEVLRRVLLNTVRKIRSMGALGVRSALVLRRLAAQLEKHDSFKAVSRQLNRLIETASQNDTENFSSVIGNLVSRIGEIEIAQTRDEILDPTIKSVINKAVQRAADIALTEEQPISAEQVAKRAAKLFSADFPIQSYSESRNNAGRLVVSNPSAVGVSDTDVYEAVSPAGGDAALSPQNSYYNYSFAVSDTEAGDTLPPARGAVISGGGGALSDAAVFLLEKAEEQLLEQRPDAVGIVSLRETELAGLINELTKEHFDRLTEISGSSAEKVVREATEAVRYAKDITVRTIGAVRSPDLGGQVPERREPEQHLPERTMTSSLMSRVTGYIADKLSYEDVAGVSQISALNGGDSYREYRILAQAERYASQNISAQTLKQSNYVINNRSGVYSAQHISSPSTETFFGESFEGAGDDLTTVNKIGMTQNFASLRSSVSSVDNTYLNNNEISYREGDRSESNTAVINNINGNPQSITQQSYPVQPVSNTEISYSEGNVSESNTAVTNNIDGNTQNITDLTGSVSPVSNTYLNNADISYSEGNVSESSTTVTNNIDGNTQNITDLSGSVSPVSNTYLNNTEISYSEGDRNDINTPITNNIDGNIQNITNLSGSVSPVSNTYPNNTEISYTEGSTNESNTLITDNINGNIQSITNHSGSVSSISNTYQNNNTSIVNNIDGNTQSITQQNGSVTPINNAYPSNTEISYSEGNVSENSTSITNSIDGNTQNITNPSGSVAPVNNTYPSNTEISYSERNVSESNTAVTKKINVNTQNITNFSGSISPVSNTYPRNTEISYSEGSINESNITITSNIDGSIQNITNLSGSVSPVSNTYPSSTEISYSESNVSESNIAITNNTDGNTQNITDPSGSISPAINTYPSNTEINYSEGSTNESNISITNNIDGNTQNITTLSGSVLPAGNTYPSSTEISYSEGSTNESNISITNNIDGNTQNITTLSGSVLPAGNTYPSSTEISYSNGSINESNASITNNIKGNIQNITQRSASVSPVSSTYPSSTEIIYNENDPSESTPSIINNIDRNTQNITQLKGSVSPANNSFAVDASIVYNENNTNVFPTRSTEPLPQALLKMQGERPRAIGHARPFRRGERHLGARHTGADRKTDSEQGTVSGRVLRESYFREIAYTGSRYIRENAEPVKPENTPFTEQAVSADIIYRDDGEIFRPTQRDGMLPANKISSYRDRLDSKTLETLDKIISRAQESRAVEVAADMAAKAGIFSYRDLSETVVQDAEIDRVYSYQNRQQLVHVENYTDSTSERSITDYGTLITEGAIPKSVGNAEMNILFRSLKNAAKLKTSIRSAKARGTHLEGIISALEQEAGMEKSEITASRHSFSFRTLDEAEEMVMLVPPSPMDSGLAESSYVRSLPPIEHRQREEQEVPPRTASKPKVINNTRTSTQTVKNPISGGFENMTREEINKIADMVYSQLQTRIMRERRRIGM